jgi:hypothetical protein
VPGSQLTISGSCDSYPCHRGPNDYLLIYM